jgi:acylpyruvate hydrolase
VRLATLRTSDSTIAVRVDSESAIEIDGVGDVGSLLTDPDWRTTAENAGGAVHALASIDPTSWAPVVPSPSKIVCVGLNYAAHIREMGRELPEYPTLFAKYPEALIGPYDEIVLPEYALHELDWEGELAVVVGSTARRLSEERAGQAIAGYAVINDITMRDFQYRSPEWFQGKTFENSSPFGPYLTTADSYEFGGILRTEVNDEEVQSTTTDDLVFSPAKLVSYISQIVTLNPGDVIATGTPGGVGHARKPPRYLSDGDEVVTTIDGLGTLRNIVRLGD